MHRTEWTAALVLSTAVIGGIVVLAWAWPGEFPGCAVNNLKEAQRIAVDQLSDIVKWGLGISVSVCGLYGSLLLRIKSSPGFTLAGNFLAAAIVICFAWSAYFALIWRQLLVEALYQDCITLISNPWLARPFNAFTDFFVAGLGLIALMAVLLMFSPKSPECGGG
jgi:hypothetical protein